MSDEWYIVRGGEQYGPYDVFELKELGVAGKVQPTDEIRREGMSQGVPATRVRGLLPAATEGQTALVGDEPAPERAAETPPALTPEEEAEKRRKEAARKANQEVRKRRVTGVKGAVLLNQDGKDARIRKKCIKCGTEDRSRTTLRILPGTSRTNFFCPNCRRVYPVEITGV